MSVPIDQPQYKWSLGKFIMISCSGLWISQGLLIDFEGLRLPHVSVTIGVKLHKTRNDIVIIPIGSYKNMMVNIRRPHTMCEGSGHSN